jgi:hypothetical protein
MSAVLWIRIGFNADPDKIHEVKSMRIHADPDTHNASESQKFKCLHEKLEKEVGQKTFKGGFAWLRRFFP